MCCTLATSIRKHRGASGLQSKEDEHSNARTDEKKATTKTLNQERRHCGDNHVENLEDTVDEELDGGVGDTNGVEDLVEVVGDQAVAGPLGEEGEAMMILRRLRLPGWVTKADQPTLAATVRSNSRAALISSNSYWTRGSCSLPSAW